MPNEEDHSDRLTLAEISEAIEFYETRIAECDLTEQERAVLRADIAMFMEMRREIEHGKPVALAQTAK